MEEGTSWSSRMYSSVLLEDCSCAEDRAGSLFTCNEGVQTLWFSVISVGMVKQKKRLS